MSKSLIAVAAFAATLAAPGHARAADDLVQLRIPVSAHDTRTALGRARLDARVDRLIRRSCADALAGDRSLAAYRTAAACRQAMRADANVKLLAFRSRTDATLLASAR